MQVYCQHCDEYLDSKCNPEHWDGEGNCVAELEYKARRNLWWEKALRDDGGPTYADEINKREKENPSRDTFRWEHPKWGG